jgi:uncharacterized protein with GYD domain
VPKFALQGRFRGETVARMIENPSDRVAAVRASMEAVGGKLDAYYWMLGDKDFLVIVDAPDSATVAAFSLAVSSSGAFSELETHELIPSEDISRILSQAKVARPSYRPPGV